MKMVTRVEKTPVDSGYAWVILAACTFMYMLMVGAIKSYGILYTEFLEYFDKGAGNTAWIGSMCTLFLLGLGPFANYLVETLTFRWVTFLAGVLVCSGYVLSAFVKQMELMYLTFGIIAGIGYGLGFSPCVTIINYYFVKNRALANGIVVAGSGVGGFALPYLYRALIDEFMLPGALMIVGSLFLNICISALLLRQPMQLVKRKILEQKHHKLDQVHLQDRAQTDTLLTEENHMTKVQPAKQKSTCFLNDLCNIFDFSLFRHGSYMAFVISVTIHMAGFTANLTVLPAHISALGYNKQQMTIAVSIVGAAEIVSRIFFGWFADRKIFQVKHILLFTMLVSGITAEIIPIFKSFEALVVYAAIVGIFPGAFWSLMSVLVVECLGLQRLPKAFGLMSMFLAFGVAFSQPSAGWIEDATGSWDSSFRFAGACSLVAALILFMEPLINKIWCCSESETPETPKDEEVPQVEVTNFLPD